MPTRQYSAMRERIGVAVLRLAAFVGDPEAVFLPGAVEQRDQAVVEQVEPVAQGPAFLAFAFAFQPEDLFGVVPRQDAAGAGQSQER